MGKEFNALELGQKLAVDFIRYQTKILAIQELLIEKKIFTQEEITNKFALLQDEETSLYNDHKQLLELTNEDLK